MLATGGDAKRSSGPVGNIALESTESIASELRTNRAIGSLGARAQNVSSDRGRSKLFLHIKPGRVAGAC